MSLLIRHPKLTSTSMPGKKAGRRLSCTQGRKPEALVRTEIDVHAYLQDLEKHLQLTLFGGRTAEPEGAVLLVRGALADGDRHAPASHAGKL